MAGYLESDRVLLREYLGYSSSFLQADSRFESAITNSQAVADGGTRPDSSLQLRILVNVAACQAIDLAIANLRTLYGATAAGKGAITIDAARETALRRSEGSDYVSRLAIALDVEVYRDPYQGGALVHNTPAQSLPRVRSSY